jgi:hypothetical protein
VRILLIPVDRQRIARDIAGTVIPIDGGWSAA